MKQLRAHSSRPTTLLNRRTALARRSAVEEDKIASMRQGRTKRLLFGSVAGIAGTIYGTIVVMATVTAGSLGGGTDAGRLAVVVGGTVLVLWIAHLYAHALAESLERRRRLDRAELGAVARRELAIPAAAVVPVAMLVLAALGFLREQTAVWLALGVGVGMLAVQGARYAIVERLGRTGTLAAIALNVFLGLVIVCLEALLAH
jgi:hypothetical protein